VNREKCLARFIELLVKHGAPERWGENIAEGIIARLQRKCFERLTDYLGTRMEVDDAVGWEGATSILSMLQNSGIAEHEKGVFYLRGVWYDFPTNARAAWRRRDCNAYQKAKNRSPWAPIDRPIEEPETDNDLFGQKEGKTVGKSKTPPQPTPGYTEFIDHWFGLYRQTYGRDYFWQAKDGRNLKRLLRGSDLLLLKAAADRYFAATESFYRGHPFDLYIGRINTWLSVNQTTTDGSKARGGLAEEKRAKRIG